MDDAAVVVNNTTTTLDATPQITLRGRRVSLPADPQAAWFMSTVNDPDDFVYVLASFAGTCPCGLAVTVNQGQRAGCACGRSYSADDRAYGWVPLPDADIPIVVHADMRLADDGCPLAGEGL